MYDKWAIDFRDRYKDFFDNVEKEACNEARKSIAKNMVNANFPDSDIARLTSLSIEDVAAIRRSLIL